VRRVPWLAGILALAAGLRVAHVLALRGTVWFDHLVVDPAFYDAWARRIAAGDWLGGDRAFYMDPLYPYALAGLYALVGRDLLVVRLVQVGLSVASCAFVARLGRRVGGPAVGLVAALGFALYKPEIFYTTEIEKTCLSVFLVSAALALFFEPSLAGRTASGLALGLASLTRANLLLMGPLGALALLRLPAGGRRAAALFLAGFACALAPVAWRNHHVAGAWVLTTTQGGQNFYIGNNPANLSGSYGTLPFVRGNPAFEEDDFRAEAERRAGRPLDAGAVSRFWYGEALRFLAARPDVAVELALRKVALFFNDFEISDNQDQYLLERDSWVMRLPLPGFGLVFALAAFGAIVGLRSSPPVRALCIFTAVYALSVAAFFVFSRYRIQVVPALLPIAALGVGELWRRVQARRPAPLLGAGAIVAGAALFSLHTIDVFDRNEPRVVAMRLQKLAYVQMMAGESDRAIASLTDALDACPERCPQAVDALVDLYRQQGRAGDGAAFLRAFVARHPRNATAAARLRELGG
jgi:4-amino-4-deoxy-L-arabinose transferase-like glycosyltransferase